MSENLRQFTRDYPYDIRPTTVTYGITTPYPGTPLYDELLADHPEMGDGTDIDAREAMMRAVVTASLAFSNTRLGNVHAMALPLGGWCHVAHGTAVAALLPHVMEFNRSAAPTRKLEYGA